MRVIDFARMKLVQTTFVERDYRHVESDVVLTAPLRIRGRSRRRLMIYILIEHQSEPDPLMPLRMLEYVVQIFKFQTRNWSARHRSFARLRIEPVLPVVFYTGVRRWNSIGTLTDLIELGERFVSVTPLLQPLFLNLATIVPGRLESEGGFFGSVLQLVQQRTAQASEFEQLLRRVVLQLENMPARERLRWLELLSYVHALVYHQRDPSERTGLQKAIEASVQTDVRRKEVFEMGKTIAQEIEQRGKQTGELHARKTTLVRQLRKRFGAFSAEIEQTIESTEDVAQLDEWLDRFATAKTLREVGIAS